MGSANRLIEQKDLRAQVERLAWLRVGALGDLLVGLASLVEAAKLFPNAKVTVIGPKVWCEILSPELYTYVEQIAVIEKRGKTAKIYRSSDGKSWHEIETKPLGRVFSEMRAFVNTNIDSYRYGLTAIASGVPIRVGSAPREMAWLYTHTSPFFGKDPLIHERDAPLLLLELARSGLGRMQKSVTANRQELTNYIKQSEFIGEWRKRGLPRGKPADPVRAQALTGCPFKKYVLINPTSSRREKAWPSEKFRELMMRARTPLKEIDCELLVLGAPSETAWLKEVAKDDYQIIQPPTIGDLQDVLASSRGLLTNTSSVQFIAAMTGAPTLTLMGRARAEIWGPVGARDHFVTAHLTQNETAVTDIFAEERQAYESIAVEMVLPELIQLVAHS